MPEQQLHRIADEADFIVNGFAFTRFEGNVRVLNLSAPNHAALLTENGEMLETSMDDIELGIACEYLKRNREFLAA